MLTTGVGLHTDSFHGKLQASARCRVYLLSNRSPPNLTARSENIMRTKASAVNANGTATEIARV